MAWHQDATGGDGEPSDEVIESHRLMARLSVAWHHTARTLKRGSAAAPGHQTKITKDAG